MLRDQVLRLVVLAEITLMGCGKGSGGPGSRPASPNAGPLEQLGKDWTAARTDAEKWAVTTRAIALSSPNFYGKPHLTIEEQAREHILMCDSNADEWLDRFPGILKYLEFEAEDLPRLASTLAATERMHWCVPGQNGSLIRAGVKRSYGEVARGWLLLLTGVDFPDTPAFARWHKEVGNSLKWSTKAGKFEWAETRCDSAPASAPVGDSGSPER